MMMLRQSQAKLVFLVILGCFCCSVFTIFYILTHHSNLQCNCPKLPESHNNPQISSSKTGEGHGVSEESHKLCILVPFRDRFEELLEFAPHMNSFLTNQNVDYEIYILNQADKLRFNRAYLINAGFRESDPSCDYIAMHDVDLLPANPALHYKYPETNAFHVSSYELHPKYDYPTFIGGILLISRASFKKVNGMSNKYWGWGLEDDEFYVRMRRGNIMVERPTGIRTGRAGTFRHLHSSKERSRDQAKCYNQRNLTRRLDKETGVSNTVYTVKHRRRLSIDNTQVNFLDIELECDRELTPWCNCTGAPRDTNPPDRSRDEDVVVPLIPRKKKQNKKE